jgi:hypothetical protein
MPLRWALAAEVTVRVKPEITTANDSLLRDGIMAGTADNGGIESGRISRNWCLSQF